VSSACCERQRTVAVSNFLGGRHGRPPEVRARDWGGRSAHLAVAQRRRVPTAVLGMARWQNLSPQPLHSTPLFYLMLRALRRREYP
jgi:hypothetical protein